MLSADFIVETLIGFGINTFFVLTGGAVAPLIDAIARNKDANIVCVQHEQAASMAVDGYYRATGRPACVVVTSGPGVQNILNGVCGCYYDSVPALFISGQVNMLESLDAIHAKPRQVGFQETPVVECFRPFTKFIHKILTAEDVGPALCKALGMMHDGRKGPSLLDIPVNIQMSNLDYVSPLPIIDPRIEPSSGKVDTALVHDLLQNASRPLIVLGDGARTAKDAVIKVLRLLEAPFTAAWGGLDLVPTSVVGDNQYLGPHGVYGDRVANFALQNADLLLILGARLDTRQTGGKLNLFSTQSKKIMVDIDHHEISKLSERGVLIDIRYEMDVGEFILQSTLLEAKRLANIDEWLKTLKLWKEKYGAEVRPVFDGFVSPYTFLEKLNNFIPSNAIVAIDTGATLVWAFQTLQSRSKDQRIFSNLGNSSMGYALPGAIGAAIGNPLRPVICITGDGGFLQNIQELITAAHYNLNIKIFVFNNRGYGIIKQFQNSYLGGRHVGTCAEDLNGGKRIDFVTIAQAFDVKAQHISSCAELTYDLVNHPGLAVFDINIHEEQGIQPKTDFGNSIENMSPFIESKADMIVQPPPRLHVSGWVKL